MGAGGAAGGVASPAWIPRVCRQAREAERAFRGVGLRLCLCAVLEKKKPTRCSSQKRVASLLKLPPGCKSPGASGGRRAVLGCICGDCKRGMRLLDKSPGGGSESRSCHRWKRRASGKCRLSVFVSMCSVSPEDVDNSKLWKVFGAVLDAAGPRVASLKPWPRSAHTSWPQLEEALRSTFCFAPALLS